MCLFIEREQTGSVSLTTNPAHHAQTKHISVPYHYIREQVELGNVKVEYIPTEAMPADGLTKPLTGTAFTKFPQDAWIVLLSQFRRCTIGAHVRACQGSGIF
jgi:hypothetical protein